MKDTARAMLPGIAFEFRSVGEGRSAKPSLHLRRNVFPMFKESLHNIAKHAQARRVEIQVKVTARRFELCVKDDGVGFSETRVRGGNGLKNLRRRAAELHATLEIQSQPGHGTSVTLTAPIT
jgi:signal transduction histidine kinase